MTLSSGRSGQSGAVDSYSSSQGRLFSEREGTPAERFDQDVTRRALDELFTLARQYTSSKAYRELVEFVVHFRSFAPYNAMLLHVQHPGATYAATAGQWQREYGRLVKPNARPLVVLRTMGPVSFVFDVSDTEPGPEARSLPPEVTDPFAVRNGYIGTELPSTIGNAIRDGVRVLDQDAGSASAGFVQLTEGNAKLCYPVRLHPTEECVDVPHRYDLVLNGNLSCEAQYATLVHELAHLYCGHLGTPNPLWWPDRCGLESMVEEFGAESVCYLVCKRAGIDNPSERYLGLLADHPDVPPISLECVMKAAGLIERMGRMRLPLRKAKKR